MHRAINLPNAGGQDGVGANQQIARSLPMVVPVMGGSKPPFGVTDGPPELETDDAPAHGDILSSIQSIAKSLISEPFGEMPRRSRPDL